MCGRYTLTASPEQVQQAFDLRDLPVLSPRYNIAPTQPVAIITGAAPDTLTPVLWGLIPSWAKDATMASRLINARAETLVEKPSFKDSFKRRRCLIPADGFFEWQTVPGGKKKPQFITVGQREVFAFAGLWDVWPSPAGNLVSTCTIITTEPNEFIRPLHHRMAVILDKDQYGDWLAAETPLPVLQELLRPYASDRLQAYEVSPLVNNATVDVPEIIAPYTPPQQRSLL
ncbi:MAG: SOS response-associated peptidase [Anaerolineae bacterium]|jgi:putative SOS response-associated peptidase YedK|nr:SOS response-associated peptidase [Anaerolineae bacterium]